jgi:methylated-DNA-[protein]-cysteine S-methyltransferase
VPRFTYLDSPIGPLLVVRDDEGITAISFHPAEAGDEWTRDDSAFDDAAVQLREYFAGKRTTFDLPLAPHGTGFQLAVWNELRRIPYGETRSYRDVANAIGKPAAIRAVGAANGANPIPIVVPCHRVIGSNGSLTGFGGGLLAKRYLLDLECGALF